MFGKTLLSAALAAAMLTGCMSDREYQLRKRQLQNQAAYPPTYELFTVSGPFKLELAEGGAAKVAVPNQPFQAIPIPDGAGGTSVMKNSHNTTTTTTNGGCY